MTDVAVTVTLLSGIYERITDMAVNVLRLTKCLSN